jgi:photosystem II stability/assembly factor-like uncharacterized protein
MLPARARLLLATTIATTLAACGSTSPTATTPAPTTPDLAVELPPGRTWTRLPTEPYRGKQDDIFFVTPERGWYGNGDGKVFRTDDGGASWTLVWSQPGTYVRALGFLDADHGLLGNIGTEYFPGVSDEVPLYQTADGGATWTPVTLPAAPVVKGICAIDIVHSTYIDAGRKATRTVIHAAGRVGGPAYVLRSIDGGATWTTLDLNAQAAMILDVKFFDEMNGLVMASSDAAVERTNALILRTVDGGKSWTEAYRSARPMELIWKASFPTREVGYATIMSYDEAHPARFVAKTTDGGASWQELPLDAAAGTIEFGIGFASPELGWIGTGPGGLQTRDGGRTWTPVELGQATNKIRIVPAPGGFVAYAIGVEVHRLDARP